MPHNHAYFRRNPQKIRHLDPPVNLLANAYAGSNPALPTMLKINDLGSRKAPFLLLDENLRCQSAVNFQPD